MRTIAKGLACVAAGLFVSASAQAAVSITQLGTSSPPATLGGVAMTPFAPDTQPHGFATAVSGAALDGSNPPSGSVVSFSNPLAHIDVTGPPGGLGGWGSWSHGYMGDVYFGAQGQTSLTMTLPAGTARFYFYWEPNPFSIQTATVTATDSGGASSTSTQTANGSLGATGFGIIVTGATLSTIQINATTDFAVGEFGIAIPGPAALALLGTAGLVSRRRRRA